MPKRIRIFSKKPTLTPGVCILSENGVLCPNPVASRGLCNRHRAYMLFTNQLEKYGLPPQDRRHDLRPNPFPSEGLCAVLENRKACTEAARRCGLCNRHYQSIWQRPDLNLADFINKQAVVYSRNSKAKPGKCVVREQTADGKIVVCDAPNHARGLCERHYKRLSPKTELFEQLADPKSVQPTYRLKQYPKDGICVIAENDVGCSTPATRARRVCDTHYHALDRAGKLHELTDQFIKKGYVLGRKAPSAMVPGYCLMVVNGVDCSRTPKRRGLCDPCIRLIEKNGRAFDDFALPLKHKAPPVLMRKQALIKGVCIASENGQHCEMAASTRGLCQAHYNLATRLKCLSKIGLTATELLTVREIPHFYFDKNVIIRFAAHELFGTTPDRNSVKLVEAVLDRRIRATVSLDCIRAAYSHLGHRLARAKSAGGKDMESDEAERTARKYVGELFFGRNGFWNFLPFTDEAFKSCAHNGRLPNLSLEDALEVHLFGQTKMKYGNWIFVTADGGILQNGQGVHPEKVVHAYPDIFKST